MKRLISALSALSLVFSLFLSTSCADASKDFVSASYVVRLSSDCAFVSDLNTGEESYFGMNENSTVYPASTTKLLTALCALEVLEPDYLISPGDEVYLPPSGSSFAYIRPHHTLTLEMLIEAMIIPSGGDAAFAIAAAVGEHLLNITESSLDHNRNDYNKAIECFVDYMNRYAVSLGCTNSHFTTPDGFAGSENYSSIHDMAVISKAAAECDIITEYAAMAVDNVVYASGHTNTWKNTNKLLDADSEFYCQNVIGLKTGSLDNNYCLVALYDDGENRFLCGVFGAANDSKRYSDILTLISAETEIRNIH